eukprot:tig00021234_g19422.t1
MSNSTNTTTYVRIIGVEDPSTLVNATVTLGPCAVAGVRPVPGTNDTLEFTVLAGAPPGVYDLRVVSPVQGTAKLDDAVRVVDAEVPKVVSVADPVVSNRANISTVGVNVAGLVPNTSAPLVASLTRSPTLPNGSPAPHSLPGPDEPALPVLRVTRLDNGTLELEVETAGAKPGKYDLTVATADGTQPAARLPHAVLVTGLGPLGLAAGGVQDRVVSTQANLTTYVRVAGVEDAAALANATVTLARFTVLAGALPGVYDLRVVSPVQGTAKLDDAVRVVDAEVPKVVSVADPVVSNRANISTVGVNVAGLVPNTSAPLVASLTRSPTLPNGSPAPHSLPSPDEPALPVLRVTRLDNGTLELEVETAGAKPGKYDLTVATADGTQPAARLPHAVLVTGLGPLGLAAGGVQDRVVSTQANLTTYVRVAGVEDAAALANATVTLGPCAVAGVRPVPGTNDTLEFTVLAGAPPGVYDLRVVSPVQGTAKLDDAVRVVDAEVPKVVSVADPVVSNRANISTVGVNVAGLVPNTSAPLVASLTRSPTLPNGSPAPHSLPGPDEPALPVLRVTRLDNGTLELEVETAGAKPGKYDLTVATADGTQPAARLPHAVLVTGLGPLGLAAGGVQDRVVSTQANLTTYVRVAGVEDAAALANATVTLGPCAVAGVRPVPGTNDTLEFTVLAGAPPGVYDLRVVSPVQGTAKLDDAVRVVDAEVPKVVSVADPVVSNRANISTVGVNVAGLVPNTSAPLVASLTRSPTLPNGSPAPHSLPGPDEPALPVLRVTRLDNGTLELEVETAGAKPGKYDLTVATADGTQPAARLPHAVLVTGLGPLGLAAGGVQDRVVSTQANLTTYVRVAGVEDAAALANATVTLGPCAVAGVRPVPGTNDTLEFTVLAGALPGVYDLRVVSPVQGTAKLDDAVRVTKGVYIVLVPKVVSVADPVVSNRANISTVGVNVAGLVPNTSAPLVASLTRSPTLPNGSPAPHSLPSPDEPALPVLRVTRLDNGTLELEVETAGAKPGKYDLTVATADGTQPAARLPHAVLVTGLGPLGLAAGGVQDRVVSTQANLTTYVRVAGVEDAAALANATVTLARVVSPVQGTAKLDDAVRVVDAEVPKVVSVADPVYTPDLNLGDVTATISGGFISAVHRAGSDSIVCNIGAGTQPGFQTITLYFPGFRFPPVALQVLVVATPPPALAPMLDTVVSNAVLNRIVLDVVGLPQNLTSLARAVLVDIGSGAWLAPSANIERFGNGSLRIEIVLPVSFLHPGTYPIRVFVPEVGIVQQSITVVGERPRTAASVSPADGPEALSLTLTIVADAATPFSLSERLRVFFNRTEVSAPGGVLPQSASSLAVPVNVAVAAGLYDVVIRSPGTGVGVFAQSFRVNPATVASSAEPVAFSATAGTSVIVAGGPFIPNDATMTGFIGGFSFVASVLNVSAVRFNVPRLSIPIGVYPLELVSARTGRAVLPYGISLLAGNITVRNISPTDGPLNMAFQLTVSGSNFAVGDTSLWASVESLTSGSPRLNATGASVVNTTAIRVSLPATIGSLPKGPVLLTLHSSFMKTVPLSGLLDLNSPARIDSVWPQRGPSAGSMTVTIAASGLLSPDPGRTYSIGGKAVSGANVSGAVALSVPANTLAAGTHDISIISPRTGVATVKSNLTLVDTAITSVEPALIGAGGARPVTVFGTGFFSEPTVLVGVQRAQSAYLLNETALVFVLGPTTAGDKPISVTFADGSSATLDGFSLSVLPSLKVESALYSPLGTSLEITFDKPVKQASEPGANQKGAASDVFAPSTLAKLGEGATVLWLSDDTLRVDFGAGYTIKPGDSLEFVPKLTPDAEDGVPFEGRVGIAPGSVPSLEVAVSYLGIVSPLEPIVITAKPVAGFGGHAVNLAWECLNDPCPAVLAEAVAEANARNNTAALSGLVGSGSRVLTVPRALPPGTRISVAVTTTSLAFNTTYREVVSVLKAEKEVPRIAILGGSAVKSTKGKAVELRATAQRTIIAGGAIVSDNATTGIRYGWSVVSANMPVPPKVQDIIDKETTNKLKIPPGLLPRRGQFKFKFTAALEEDETAVSEAVVYLQVPAQPVVAQLEGGSSRKISALRTFTLDASRSRSLDDPTIPLLYCWLVTEPNKPPLAENILWRSEWLPTPLLDVNPATFGTGGAGRRLRALSGLPIGSLHTFTVLASEANETVSEAGLQSVLSGQAALADLSFGLDGQVDTTTQTIGISNNDVPVVSIKANGGANDPTLLSALEDVVLEASVKLPPGYDAAGLLLPLVWSEPPGQNLNLSGRAARTTASSSAVTLPVELLSPGVRYSATVTVLVGALSAGESTLEFGLNTPPAGGRCAVSPAEGVALQTLFRATCEDWVDAQTPLRYQLKQYDPRSGVWLPLTSPKVSSEIVALLSPLGGNETAQLAVEISDTRNASVLSVLRPVRVVAATPEQALAAVAAAASGGSAEEALQAVTGVTDMLGDFARSLADSAPPDPDVIGGGSGSGSAGSGSGAGATPTPLPGSASGSGSGSGAGAGSGAAPMDDAKRKMFEKLAADSVAAFAKAFRDIVDGGDVDALEQASVLALVLAKPVPQVANNMTTQTLGEKLACVALLKDTTSVTPEISSQLVTTALDSFASSQFFKPELVDTSQLYKMCKEAISVFISSHSNCGVCSDILKQDASPNLALTYGKVCHVNHKEGEEKQVWQARAQGLPASRVRIPKEATELVQKHEPEDPGWTISFVQFKKSPMPLSQAATALSNFSQAGNTTIKTANETIVVNGSILPAIRTNKTLEITSPVIEVKLGTKTPVKGLTARIEMAMPITRGSINENDLIALVYWNEEQKQWMAIPQDGLAGFSFKEEMIEVDDPEVGKFARYILCSADHLTSFGVSKIDGVLTAIRSYAAGLEVVQTNKTLNSTAVLPPEEPTPTPAPAAGSSASILIPVVVAVVAAGGCTLCIAGAVIYRRRKRRPRKHEEVREPEAFTWSIGPQGPWDLKDPSFDADPRLLEILNRSERASPPPSASEVAAALSGSAAGAGAGAGAGARDSRSASSSSVGTSSKRGGNPMAVSISNFSLRLAKTPRVMPDGGGGAESPDPLDLPLAGSGIAAMLGPDPGPAAKAGRAASPRPGSASGSGSPRSPGSRGRTTPTPGRAARRGEGGESPKAIPEVTTTPAEAAQLSARAASAAARSAREAADLAASIAASAPLAPPRDPDVTRMITPSLTSLIDLPPIPTRRSSLASGTTRSPRGAVSGSEDQPEAAGDRERGAAYDPEAWKGKGRAPEQPGAAPGDTLVEPAMIPRRPSIAKRERPPSAASNTSKAGGDAAWRRNSVLSAMVPGAMRRASLQPVELQVPVMAGSPEPGGAAPAGAGRQGRRKSGQELLQENKALAHLFSVLDQQIGPGAGAGAPLDDVGEEEEYDGAGPDGRREAEPARSEARLDRRRSSQVSDVPLPPVQES